jgi:ATP-dependent DNA helicase RecQ
MWDYLQNKECLMAMLRRELDDPHAEPCGKCAVCAGSPLVPESFAPELEIEALQYLRRTDQPIEPRLQWPLDALERYGWSRKIPDELRAEVGRALCLWGDAGWGEAVRRGKHDGSFETQLVVAAAAMLRERWKPEPWPKWVTCVPSAKHPKALPRFAERLAKEIRVPFVPCVRRVRSGPPQKTMTNSYQQAKNLAGAFKVSKWKVKAAPVLLVDDIVDSRWTFTIVAALLRQAGSGPVFPLALAQATAK